MKRKYIKILSVALPTAAATVLITGCVSVPDQTQIVNKDLGENRSVIVSSCDEKQARFYSDPERKSAHELDANNISILNWNIYKGEKKNWASDFRQLSNGRDLVIIQEARLNNEVKNTLKEQSINWTLNTGFYVNDEATGVLTGSKVKPVSSCGLRATEPFLRLPKTALINKYNISGTDEKLLVANIHSINFTLGTEVYGAQIMALKIAIKDHQGPVIVAGDFNSWSDGRKAIIDKMVTDLSLRSVTYKSKNRITVFGNEIDHVFYRGLESIASEAQQVTSSDHNPIKVTFRIPVSEQEVALNSNAN